MRSIAVLLALAASALAYQVTEPDSVTGWTTAGSNVVSWDKVSTDAANFTIVLVNQVRELPPLVPFLPSNTHISRSRLPRPLRFSPPLSMAASARRTSTLLAAVGRLARASRSTSSRTLRISTPSSLSRTSSRSRTPSLPPRPLLLLRALARCKSFPVYRLDAFTC